MKLRSFILPITAAGILAAQTQTQVPAQAPSQQHAQVHRRSMVDRLGKRLNLTADQQAQARSIFKSAREQAKAMAPQLRQEHQAMAAAIKTDNEVQIDQIVQQNAKVNAQARAIHAKAMAKFYSILSPDQKAKFDQGMNRRSVNAARAGHKVSSQS